jgi:hypothetical protein
MAAARVRVPAILLLKYPAVGHDRVHFIFLDVNLLLLLLPAPTHVQGVPLCQFSASFAYCSNRVQKENASEVEYNKKL